MYAVIVVIGTPALCCSLGALNEQVTSPANNRKPLTKQNESVTSWINSHRASERVSETFFNV